MWHTIIAYLLIGSIVCLFCCKLSSQPKANSNFEITPSISNALKGILAIIIICHHWCLYTYDGEGVKWIIDPLPRLGGHFCLILFLFLSGYGICISEFKHNNSFSEYAEKRLWKIYKHFLIIYALTFLAYYFFMPKNMSQQMISENHLNPFIFEIGANISFDTIFQFFGPKMDWYIWTTLVMYILFYISFQISKKFQNQKVSLGLTFVIFLIAYYIFAYYYYGKPLAHYYRNLWAFGLGVLVSLFPNIKNCRFSCLVLIILGYNYLVEGSDYAKVTIFSLAVLFLLGYGNKFYTLKSSFFTWLGAISFSLYLSHRMWYNLLWSCDCLNLILFVVISLLFAALYNYTNNVLLKKHSVR